MAPIEGVVTYAFEYLVPVFWGSKSFMISPLRPVVDGDVVTEHPVPAALAGIGAGVDLISMHRAWASFASTGDPGWAPYDLERRTTMRFDVDGGPVDDLAGSVERELWADRR